MDVNVVAPTSSTGGGPSSGTTGPASSNIAAAPGISTSGLGVLAAVMLLVTALAVGRASGSRRAT